MQVTAREREMQDADTRSAEKVSEELKKSSPMISALYEVLTTLQLPTDGTQSTSLSRVGVLFSFISSLVV